MIEPLANDSVTGELLSPYTQESLDAALPSERILELAEQQCPLIAMFSDVVILPINGGYHEI